MSGASTLCGMGGSPMMTRTSSVHRLPSHCTNVVAPVLFHVTIALNTGTNNVSRAARKHHYTIASGYTTGCSRLAAKTVRSVGEGEDSDVPDPTFEKHHAIPDWDPFTRWNVPWDGKTVIVTMVSFGFSFLLTGLSLSVLISRIGFGRRQLLDLDQQAILIFTNQFVQTIVGITVINICIKSYRPLPNDFFNYDWRNPLDIKCGWLLWSIVGIFLGATAVLIAGAITTALSGQPLPREEQDALLKLLPLIGASNTSTTALVAVTGILAPYLEETFFRGFLMTSLTKWMPTSAAVIVSASAFALAHLIPGEIPQLFSLGVVLGFSYLKSRNLLTPIMIHAMWNSGVILLLTVLRLQGYDIQELI